MKKFLAENPTLAFGLALPLLIVAVFLGAAALSDMGATPPKYGVLFSNSYYPNNEGVVITIENKKAHVVYIGEQYMTPPKFYLYTPSSGEVREIAVTVPPEIVNTTHTVCCLDPKKPKKITPLSVPELEKLTLYNPGTAPDGYEFRGYDSYSSALDGGLIFGRGSYHSGAILQKGGHKVIIPQSQGGYYYGGSSTLIGWVEQP